MTPSKTCRTCHWWLPNFDPQEFQEIVNEDGGGIDDAQDFWGCNSKIVAAQVDCDFSNMCSKPDFGCIHWMEKEEVNDVQN